MRSDELTEERALAILLTNLNRKAKVSETLEIAQACRYLRDIYGSYEMVAKRVKAGDETIRQYAKIAGLPDEVKDLIRNGLLRGMEVPFQISRIGNPQRMLETAKAVGDMSSMDARDTIKYVLKHPRKLVEACKRRIIESKRTTVDVHVILVPLSEPIVQKLREGLRKKSMSNQIEQIVEQWLKPKGPISCNIQGKVLALSLEKDDYEKLRTKEPNIILESYINDILERQIAANTNCSRSS